MTPAELEAKFLNAAGEVKFWASTHGKATAVIIAFIVGAVLGWLLHR